MHRITALLLTLAMFASVDAAAQADAPLFDYQINAKTQTDQGTPMLVLRARESIKEGTVTFERHDGKTNTVRLGKMQPLQERRIPFQQPKGSFKWRVTVKGASTFDQTTHQQFETETALVDPIKLDVNKELVDTGAGQLVLRSNVPIDKVDIEVFDKNGGKLIETTQTIGGKSGDLPIQWAATAAEVGAVRLRAHDIAGFWSAVLLEPFWVEIDHHEVEFHFGKATWDDAEIPKLEHTLKEVQQAMERHASKGLKMQLYIAGYTDTVGSASDNIALSNARARAIAAWFKKAGLKIPVFYQGFGESVLAVQTPDNTPEARNRRALYILGASPPPTSGQIPKRNWNRL